MTPEQKESLRDVLRGSSATLLLFLAYTIFPLIGAPAGLVAPYPAVFYSLKLGRNGGLAIILLVTAALALTDLSVAVLYLFQAGLLSFLLPEFLRRGSGGARSIAGAVSGVIAVAGSAATVFVVTHGIDVSAMIRKGVALSIAQTAEFYKKSGLTSEELATVQDALTQGGALIGLTYPALLTLFMITVAGITLSLVQRNAVRLPIPPVIGTFSAYRNPDHLVWVLIGSGFCLLLSHPILFQVALNALIITLCLYFIQGLAIIATFFDRYKVSPLLRSIFYVVLAIQPYLTMGVALLGLFDLWFTFRTPKQGENL